MSGEARLVAFGTRKSIKENICNKVNVLQKRCPNKRIERCEDLISNIGDFKKHFNNEEFLDFMNKAM